MSHEKNEIASNASNVPQKDLYKKRPVTYLKLKVNAQIDSLNDVGRMKIAEDHIGFGNR